MKRTPADIRDLETLSAIKARRSPKWIAKNLNMPEETVRQRLHEIVRDDCAHDPEAKAYWTKTWRK